MLMCRKCNARDNHSMKVGNKSFERVEQFEYLGATTTNQSCSCDVTKRILVFLFAIQKHKHWNKENYNFICGFVWVRNVVFHTAGLCCSGLLGVNTAQRMWSDWPHPPSSVHSKKPSAAQPRRLSRYGHLKAEDIHKLYSWWWACWCPKHVEINKNCLLCRI
jgi:hypothetical protein